MSGAIFGLAGVIFGALVSYLIARRAKSGRIATSEAETLWKEATAMRIELRAEVNALRKAYADCQARTLGLERRVRELEAGT